MKYKIYKIFGLIRILVGLLLIVIGLGALVNILVKNIDDGFLFWSELLFTFLCFEYLGFYLIYSGWHTLKRRENKYDLLTWIAIATSILWTTKYLKLIFGDKSIKPDLPLFILISFFLIPCIVDIAQLVKRKVKP